VRPRNEDRGSTLVEVLIAMIVLSLLLVVFVRAVSLMTSTTTRVTTTGEVATEGRAASDALGRQLAVASATNTPVFAGGNWYLEFSTDDVKAGSDRQCTQWRYQPSTRRLQYRTWSVVTLVASAWIPVSDAMVNTSGQPPFTVYPSDSTFMLPRVAVDLRLATTVGSVVQTQGQYTLRNSLDAPPPGPSTVCTQLGRP
jgi:prepilin-type N-terminal cleavage/methylation domain-containing protein